MELAFRVGEQRGRWKLRIAVVAVSYTVELGPLRKISNRPSRDSGL